jgi:hypothetical protein
VPEKDFVPEKEAALYSDNGRSEAYEQRRETEYRRSDPAKVRVLSGVSSSFSTIILDISRSGLRVELDSPLSRGTALEITLPNEVIIFGEVRFCRQIAGNCYAAVSIQHVFYARRRRKRGYSYPPSAVPCRQKYRQA